MNIALVKIDNQLLNTWIDFKNPFILYTLLKMKISDRQYKKLIKWMIKTFYNNFSWYDLDSIFWKNNDLFLNEFLENEYPKYTLKECKQALNIMLYNRKLIIENDRKYWTVLVHWMKLERL